MKLKPTFFYIIFGLFTLVGSCLSAYSQISIVRIEVNNQPTTSVCAGDILHLFGQNLDDVDAVTIDGSLILPKPPLSNDETFMILTAPQLDDSATIVIIDTNDPDDPDDDVSDEITIMINDIPTLNRDENNFDENLCQGVDGNFNLIKHNTPGGDFYFWDFGDGDLIQQDNPVFTFTPTELGTFDLTVWIEDDGCRSESETVEITVNPTPVSSIQMVPTDLCVGEPGTFIAEEAAMGSGTNIKYSWNFGNEDSISESDNEVTYSYGSSGDFTRDLQGDKSGRL